MVSADYLRHLKFLGKLAFGYDQAASGVTALTTLQATIMDQVADAALSSLPEVVLLAGYMASWTSSLSSANQLQILMKNIASALLTSDDFVAGLVTNLPASRTVQGVLDAWKAEFTTDSKTLTTSASTGLLHFLATLGTVTSWPASGSPTYPDATYVVSAVI